MTYAGHMTYVHCRCGHVLGECQVCSHTSDSMITRIWFTLQAGYAVDECGVCGGSGDSCALVLSLQSDSLAASSAPTSHPSQARTSLLEDRLCCMRAPRGFTSRLQVCWGAPSTVYQADFAPNVADRCLDAGRCAMPARAGAV